MTEMESAEGKGKYYPMIVLSNKKLLLDDTFTDLIIKVGNETVQAHAAIICCRCTELLGPPTDEKSKKARKKLEVKIKDGAIPVGIISKVLEFLYTGMVDFPKLTDKEILSLVTAARYFKLNRLAYLCERWLREHMTIESVFHLLKDATDLKEERVKGFCLTFALGHYNEFISNKDGIYILGIELFQEVVAAFQTSPAPPEEMREEDNPDTLLQDFKRMYDTMPYSDITFQVRGEAIRCHKAILAAHSDAFVNTIFRDENAVRLTPKAFHNVLKFTYYGDGEVDPLPACELVEFTRQYKLPALLRICEDKIRVSVSLETVLPILAIAYLPADGKPDLVEELKSKCFPFILQNLSKVDLSLIKASNPLLIVDLLFELQTAWKNKQYGLGRELPPNFKGGNFVAPSRPAPMSAPSSASSVKAAPPPPSRDHDRGLTTPTRPSRTTEHGAGGSLLGAQRRTPAPPPPRRGPAPSPRDGAPPPSFPTPPPRSAAPPAPTTESESDDQSTSSLSKKEEERRRKEEERRKKEDAKRALKEKKERLKMEKKFKNKGDLY